MGIQKCCVDGCNATSATNRLFCFPTIDSLRNLWLSFLIRTSSHLIGLSKEQLLRKRVCEKHFDKYQFDHSGRRLRYSYPCLITNEEISHGVPLRVTGWDNTLEHNYFKVQNEEDVADPSPETIQSGLDFTMEHNYAKLQNEDIVMAENPTCSQLPIVAPVMENRDAILDIPSYSGLRYGAETVTRPVQTVESETVKQKRSTKRQFELKKTKFIKNFTKMATESLHDSPSERLAKAYSLLSNKNELLEKFNSLNKQAQTFLLMQLKHATKSKMARRFSLEEKLMALLLLKQSPKGYTLLEKMFILPNKRTLIRLSENVLMEPGLNPQIFDHIANTCKNWDTKQKLCTIVFDEIALTPHLTFDEKRQKIIGFVDIAGERKLKYCDHALVFMLRGICHSWRQSVAYYFCEGTVSAADLQNILTQLVSQVALTGLIPLGLVCDQGSTFRTAIRRLREDSVKTRNLQGVLDDGTINVAGYDLSIFHDPPHLLKGLRNNFLTKDIIWNKKTASWKDIEFIYDIDSKLGHTRALPKITAHHVDPKKMKKMKVSIAAQVLSARTAAMLKYTDALNTLRSPDDQNTMATTAEVVEFFDNLFDSVNGYPGGAKRGKLRSAVKINSPHVSFWMDAIKKLKNINYIDKSSKHAIQLGKPRLVKVPSLQGWITTLESFIRMSKLLFNEYGVNYYYPRYINQDPLENFFGRIRSLNCRNVNPDANTFTYAFKSLLLSNVLSPHSKFANCEEDNGDNIINIKLLFENINENKENYVYTIPSSSHAHIQENISVDQVVMEKIKVHCSAYTAGYVCRKITKAINCKACSQTYTSQCDENIHTFLQFREYKSLKNNNLAYPSEKLLILYRDVSSLIHNFLNSHCFSNDIKSKLKNIILRKLRFSWLGCAKHHEIAVDIFITVTLRLQIHNWCNIINKILKGAIEDKYAGKMDGPQKLALLKYKTYRLRKKCLTK